MTETEQDLKEFIESVVDPTNFLVNVVDMTKDAWIAVLDNDQNRKIAIEGAERVRGELINRTYPQVLSAFMQPPEEDAGADEGVDEGADAMGPTTLADQLGEQEQTPPTRAGRGQKG